MSDIEVELGDFWKTRANPIECEITAIETDFDGTRWITSYSAIDDETDACTHSDFLRDYEFVRVAEQAKPERKHSHYFIPVADLEFIDVYHLCKRAKIQDDSGATHHALKKLLFSGKRGSKDRIKDLQEAVDTILRLIEIERLEGGL